MNNATRPDKVIEVEPRLYLNGFPKSGLHLLELIAASLTRPAFEKAWLGSFAGHSWLNDWANIKRFFQTAERVPMNAYLKGHCGWRKDISGYFKRNGWALVFLYRNPRDVAVSQTYHILAADDERFMHPGKELYAELGSFEDVLKAVIEGLGPYPGLFERFALYAPWLDEDWILPMTYEMMRETPEEAASLIFRYMMGRTANHYLGCGLEINKEDHDATVEMIVKNMKKTEFSPTYRKGKVGGWRNHWSDEIEEVFQAHENGWMDKLGYNDAVWE